MAEPEPVWDWRVIAAFAQAILSAGAIYSAWWLQSKKREADRREAERDTWVTLQAVSYAAEWEIAVAARMSAQGKFQPALMVVSQKGLEEYNSILRKQNLAHLPPTAVLSTVTVMQRITQASAMLGVVAPKMGNEKSFPAGHFDSLYKYLYEARSEFLLICGLKDAQRRYKPSELNPSEEIPASKSRESA